MPALIITAPQAMSAPLPGTPTLKLTGDKLILASDGFSGLAGGFAGRTTDGKLGGPPLRWSTTSDTHFRITGSGRAAAIGTVDGSWFHYLNLPGALPEQIEVGVTVVSKASSGTIYVDLFRDTTTTVSRKLRLSITPTTAALIDAQGSTSTTIPGSGFIVGNGDRIKVSVNRRTNTLQVTVNELARTPINYLPMDPHLGSIFGIAGGDVTGAVLDDFILAETVL